MLISETSFEDNYAERAGGAYFIEHVNALSTDCGLQETESFSVQRGYFSSNFECGNMKRNSVGDEGYGANVASPVKFFYSTLEFTDATRHRLGSGSSFSIPNWKSGDPLPTVEVVVVDHFHQGPALTRSKAAPDFVASYGNGLAQYTGYAKATIESPDGLFPNPLITDVSNGSGILTVGVPFQPPGEYSLVLWLADDVAAFSVINVTLRECVINEASTLHSTFCATCDSNQYNFHPDEEHCKLCPRTANCSSAFILPNSGYWNAFPCSHRIEKCINDVACKGSNATEVEEKLGVPSTDCTFSEEFVDWYQQSLCEPGYTAALCGSCTDASGRVGIFTCRHCLGKGAAVLMIIFSILIVKILAILQIKGNLESVEHRAISQVTLALNQHSRRNLRVKSYRNMEKEMASPQSMASSRRVGFQRPLDSYKHQENLAKWRFVELLKVS